MKKTSKKKKILKDNIVLRLAVLFLAVTIVVSVLAYYLRPAAPSKVQQPVVGNGVAVMNGQQTATITILPSGGSSQQTAGAAMNMDNGTSASQDSSMSAVSIQHGSVYDTNRLKFKIDHFKKLALQPLEFQIFDENGNPYTPDNLLVVHEKKMHFFVVSANLREFQHVHPTYENGVWKVLVNLPNPGTYYAYADVTPSKGSPVVLRQNLVVQKETTGTINYPGLTPDLFAITSGYKAALTLVSPKTQQRSDLMYLVTKNDKPARILPYLAADAHFIVLRHGDPDGFMHVHSTYADEAAGKAGFVTIFSQPGRYTVYSQFNLDSKIYTFPITFDVTE